MLKILYLYSEVMGYTMATIKALVASGAEVHVVNWDEGKLTPYRMPILSGVVAYRRSAHTAASLKELVEEIGPVVTVVSGWMDSAYMSVARHLRKTDKNVVLCLDNRWHGTLRQRIASVLGVLGWFRRYFSHAWVPGAAQYAYARRLGFEDDRVIGDLYSADVGLFRTAASRTAAKVSNHPHRFLFVGRFEPIKGLDTLLAAWRLIGPTRGDWQLHMVGNGSLRSTLDAAGDVIIKAFLQPEELVEELATAGCVILPSKEENWGVVVHEIAATGRPLILSDAVGAGRAFLLSGMNGYRFRTGDVEDLARAMQAIIDHPDNELTAMGQASARLSDRITPETSARNLLSLVS